MRSINSNEPFSTEQLGSVDDPAHPPLIAAVSRVDGPDGAIQAIPVEFVLPHQSSLAGSAASEEQQQLEKQTTMAPHDISTPAVLHTPEDTLPATVSAILRRSVYNRIFLVNPEEDLVSS